MVFSFKVSCELLKKACLDQEYIYSPISTRQLALIYQLKRCEIWLAWFVCSESIIIFTDPSSFLSFSPFLPLFIYSLPLYSFSPSPRSLARFSNSQFKFLCRKHPRLYGSIILLKKNSAFLLFFFSSFQKTRHLFSFSKFGFHKRRIICTSLPLHRKMPELYDNLTPFTPSYYNNLHSASYVCARVLNTVLTGTMNAHPTLLIYWPNPGTGEWLS